MPCMFPELAAQRTVFVLQTFDLLAELFRETRRYNVLIHIFSDLPAGLGATLLSPRLRASIGDEPDIKVRVTFETSKILLNR